MRNVSLRAAAAAALILVLFVGCGSGGSSGGSSSGPPGAGTVVVKANDSLRFDKKTYTAKAGTVTFDYENLGTTAHTLLIDGVDGFKLTIGKKDDGSVALDAGAYTLYCDIASHRQAGMEAELKVS
jgi:plastocyanin